MQMSINVLWYKQTEEKKWKFEDTKRMFFLFNETHVIQINIKLKRMWI
jgi:hypothetical protein